MLNYIWPLLKTFCAKTDLAGSPQLVSSPRSEELCCGLLVILPEQHVCWPGKWDLLCSHTNLFSCFSFHLIQLGCLSHFPRSSLVGGLKAGLRVSPERLWVPQREGEVGPGCVHLAFALSQPFSVLRLHRLSPAYGESEDSYL